MTISVQTLRKRQSTLPSEGFESTGRREALDPNYKITLSYDPTPLAGVLKFINYFYKG